MSADGGADIIVNHLPLTRTGLGALAVGTAAGARVAERDVGVGEEGESREEDESCGEEGLHCCKCMYGLDSGGGGGEKEVWYNGRKSGGEEVLWRKGW